MPVSQDEATNSTGQPVVRTPTAACEFNVRVSRIGIGGMWAVEHYLGLLAEPHPGVSRPRPRRVDERGSGRIHPLAPGGEELLDQQARAASEAERARVSVTKALKSAIRRIAAQDAELGEHPAHSVKTGTFVAYDPDPTVSISWAL
jgi:hypothetical protein